MLVGILLNILIHPFLHFLLGEEGPVFRLTYSGLLTLLSFLILCWLVLFFYWLKYTSFQTNVGTKDLKITLTENISKLKRSLAQEIIFIVGIFAVLFVSGRAFSQYLGNGDFWDIFHPDILISMGLMMFMIAFYIYRRTNVYRKNISELQQYLNELDEGLNR
ncbi:hypothetical protein [Pedobacter sp. SYSU D00535]|uniref:hypothetical protein n=1 Tax=Pedobacter sp. SYSU D00535 TaxID=2810308 RepID=UPI001A95EC9B|nr:hypothetical protein [Pedobacter sp. SYSU D00535]